LKKQVKKALQNVKGSFEESIYLDDEDKKGFVSLEGLKESVEIMELKIDSRLEEFIYYFMFQTSQNVERVQYGPFLKLLDEPEEKPKP
jgi:hypothetical protein